MPQDYVKIDAGLTTQKFAGDFINAIASLRSTIDQLEKMKGLMDHMTNGVLFTDIEVQFGLPTGQGQTVYNLVSGALGAMKGTVQSSDGVTLIERVG